MPASGLQMLNNMEPMQTVNSALARAGRKHRPDHYETNSARLFISPPKRPLCVRHLGHSLPGRASFVPLPPTTGTGRFVGAEWELSGAGRRAGPLGGVPDGRRLFIRALGSLRSAPLGGELGAAKDWMLEVEPPAAAALAGRLSSSVNLITYLLRWGRASGRHFCTWPAGR